MRAQAITAEKFTHPPLEKVLIPYDGSLLIRHFTKDRRGTRPYWHYHPELELVYVRGGVGKRHIGSHLSNFKNGELVLIGSNLPHQGFTKRIEGKESETVVQFLPDFLGAHFFEIPEMFAIGQLMERAKKGLFFKQSVLDRLGDQIIGLVEKDRFHQILGLLEILQALAETEEYEVLNADGFLMVSKPQDNDRLNQVLNHVKEHFQEAISLDQVCDIVGMTEPAFCRYFKKITTKTFTRFLNEYRLVHASKLLAEKQITISEVCFQSGFSNYSHFVDQFKRFTGQSPSSYRKELDKILE
ncbi:MAG: AraC family transcriptional regulator [Bacteroidota bacterium]